MVACLCHLHRGTCRSATHAWTQPQDCLEGAPGLKPARAACWRAASSAVLYAAARNSCTSLLQVDVTAAEAVLPDDQKQAQGPVTKAGAANHITAALKQLGGQAAMKSDPWAEIKTGPLRIKPHKAQNTAVQVGVSRCLSRGQQGVRVFASCVQMPCSMAHCGGGNKRRSRWSASHCCAMSMRPLLADDHSQRILGTVTDDISDQSEGMRSFCPGPFHGGEASSAGTQFQGLLANLPPGQCELSQGWDWLQSNCRSFGSTSCRPVAC